ncbi:MAG: hypothetical protein F8N38_19720 [Hungatella sp.]|nr:hypothetical protein [Hungatella sp.]
MEYIMINRQNREKVNSFAIRFYKKRGFDLAGFYHNSLDISRKIKPAIPLLGNYDIPLKHEIEFEMILLNERDVE